MDTIGADAKETDGVETVNLENQEAVSDVEEDLLIRFNRLGVNATEFNPPVENVVDPLPTLSGKARKTTVNKDSAAIEFWKSQTNILKGSLHQK